MSVNKKSLTFSFSSGFLVFLFRTHLRTFTAIVNRSEGKTLSLVPDLGMKEFSLSPWNIMLAYVFGRCPLLDWGRSLLFLVCGELKKIRDECLLWSNAFYISMKMIKFFFIFLSVNMIMILTDFQKLNQSFIPQEKTHLAMMLLD